MTGYTARTASGPPNRPTTSVAVVGAGPAGLVTAVTLAHAGVDVTLLEQRTHPSSLPRAVGLSLRHMELMRSWGLESAILEGADDVDLAVLETVTASEAANGIRRVMNVPTREQAVVVSPTAPARVAQDHIERVLLAHLGTLPTAGIRRGVEVTGIVERSASVEIATRDARTGTTEVVLADFVIAADGAHSSIRHALGIRMIGPDDMMAGLSVEFSADLWPVLGPHRYALYSIKHPDGTGVLIPTGQPRRWQFGIVLEPGDDADVVGEAEALRRRIIAASGVADLQITIDRSGPFRSAAQMAERFSSGRVFLAGDAAHRVTPRGGNGLALAIRSGHDLAWRLTWVARGWAPPSFLSTYEAEVRPVVADSVARAANPEGFCRAVVSEMLLDLGGRLPHAWVRPDVSTLDLIGPALTLLTTDDTSDWHDAARASKSPVPIDVMRLPPSAAHALGLHRPGGALLVRPDGVPISRWWSTDHAREQLDRTIDALLRPAPPRATPSPITELDHDRSILSGRSNERSIT